MLNAKTFMAISPLAIAAKQGPWFLLCLDIGYLAAFAANPDPKFLVTSNPAPLGFGEVPLNILQPLPRTSGRPQSFFGSGLSQKFQLSIFIKGLILHPQSDLQAILAENPKIFASFNFRHFTARRLVGLEARRLEGLEAWKLPSLSACPHRQAL